ncbi:thioesterase [Epidermidibacterium keratini]|uniref:Thioesterase n=1 Tax=Epidermidibacterium keratini TaxID=1891644 RepID=A0A7L4YKN6_9ACTN|nr:hotdog domain-containing protein [Epidermidibacterium keratini]QHB99378.1 thioesterase [Epidermidibacterium keratini]
MTVEVGLAAQIEIVVGAADTAAALGSGDLQVLGTPRVLALAEQATVRAVSGVLDDTETTVGIEVALQHLRASLVGARITVDATVTAAQERRLTFEVNARDGDQVVAQGTVVRMVVDTERFLARAGS